MLSRRMRDKPLKYPRDPKVAYVLGGGEGTAKHGTLPGFFINATSKLVTKLQTTRDWLIQHSNRISKLSGLSSQMEKLD